MESKHRVAQGLYPELVVLCQPAPARRQLSQPLGSSGDTGRAVTLITGIYPEGYGTGTPRRRGCDRSRSSAGFGASPPRHVAKSGAESYGAGQAPTATGKPARGSPWCACCCGGEAETQPCHDCWDTLAASGWVPHPRDSRWHGCHPRPVFFPGVGLRVFPQSPMLVPWAFLAACREGGHVPVGMALQGGRGGPAGRELHSQEGHRCHQ